MSNEEPKHDANCESAPSGTSKGVCCNRLVMPSSIGYVTFDVHKKCPHCRQDLYLNQYPYNDDTNEHNLDDEIGLAVFGRATSPANWNTPDVAVTCCRCTKKFALKHLEI